MVTGEAEDVADTQSYRTQHIALNGYPVSVAADYLHNRLNALLLQKHTASEAGHADDGSLIIGYIDCIATATKQVSLPLYYLGVSSLGRTCLGSDR
jgi:hypothetical protein